MLKARALGLLLAGAALLDNITTWLAVSVGAREMNPLVEPFLVDPGLFLAFTVGKAYVCYVLVEKTYSDHPLWVLLYSAVLALFARATIINLLNYLALLF